MRSLDFWLVLLVPGLLLAQGPEKTVQEKFT